MNELNFLNVRTVEYLVKILVKMSSEFDLK